jgi:hypothetical protein
MLDDVIQLAYKPLLHTSPRIQGAVSRLRARMDVVYADPVKYHKLYTGLRTLLPADNYPFGSVAAALVGCSLPIPRFPQGCHPLCAAALPLPQETGERNSNCAAAVVVATQTPTGLAVTQLSASKDPDAPVQLYVNGSFFNGIDEAERDRLLPTGVTADIYIGLEAAHPTLVYVPIKDIPMRGVSSRFLLIVGLGVAIVLVIVLYIGFGLILQNRGLQKRTSLPL